MKLHTRILLIDAIRRYKARFNEVKYFDNDYNHTFEYDLHTFEGDDIKIQFQFVDAISYENLGGKLHINVVSSSVWVRMWKNDKLAYNEDTVGKYIGLDKAIKFIKANRL